MDRTILLVDDEENIVAALTRSLRRDGYNILRANSGKEGLALLEQNRVGVIISDQRMPGMTGTEFLTKVKDLSPDTVRVVLSGYTELSSVIEAVNRGAVYKFFTKPWEDDLLRANVQEAFQHYEMKIENLRLRSELQKANDELKCLNQELELRVEMKTHEIVRNLSVLRVSQEILEHLPVAVLGIGEEGLIAIANQRAHLLLSADGKKPLLGELADAIIPADFLSEILSSVHLQYLDSKQYILNGRSIDYWCRYMGTFSNSNGVLLIINEGSQIEPLNIDDHVTLEE